MPNTNSSTLYWTRLTPSASTNMKVFPPPRHNLWAVTRGCRTNPPTIGAKKIGNFHVTEPRDDAFIWREVLKLPVE